jgi:hypothetical protein
VRSTDHGARAATRGAEDRYGLLRELGRGSTATVWLAYDRALRRRVALKRVLTASATGLLRLKREFRTIAPLQHRNLVRLHDLWTDDQGAFFTMDLVEGADLRSLLRDGLPASLARGGAAPFVVGVARQILAALGFLHGRGVVHRDLKPSNVMVEAEGAVKLLDFGVLAMAGGGPSTELDRLGGGTLSYAAPEQIRGEPATSASDMYSLGVLLHEVAGVLLPGRGARAVVPANLVRLCDDLVRKDHRLRPTARAALVALAAPGERVAPAVAAEPERVDVGGEETGVRAWLSNRLEGVADGGFEAVVVEAAVGRDEGMLRWAGAFVSRCGGVVLAGRARKGEHVPYNVLDAAVDAVASLLAGTVPDAELGRDLSLASAEFPVLAGKREAAPRVSRSRAFDALIRILASLAGAGGVYLLVDGLHSADAGSFAFVDRLLEHRPSGVAFVAAFSTGDAKPAARAWLHGQRRLAPLALHDAGVVWTADRAASGRIGQRGLAEAARLRALATAPGGELPEPQDAGELGQRRRHVSPVGPEGHRQAVRGFLLGGGGLDEREPDDLRLFSSARR